ncbi:MAG: heavy metal translocating P-type ATPase metal-binding domain-containing protein, partial [Proteobacteria bacterium]|nr:heavy metal translocating P-type ATPase metal-binding domain-containing protein [Pseudomonadota bacterium]
MRGELGDAPPRVPPIMSLADERSCAHCQTPVPRGRGASTFCCTGCEIVYAAIAEHGLDRYYALREVPTPGRASDRAYGELDDPAFARIHVRDGRAGASTTALYLEDLRCTACLWLVERAAVCVPGVTEVRVDLGRSRVDVSWDPAHAQLSSIARYFDRVGHPVHPFRGVDRDAQRRREDRALLVRLGVAGAALGNVMLLAIALYAGADPIIFRWASMLVAVPALGYAAWPFFRTALGAVRARRLHLDLPLSIGILAGLSWGSVNVLRGGGEIYFDSLAMLVFLLLVARWIVLRHQRRASSAAELLLALTPSRAHRREASGAVVDVPIEAVAAGDILVVLAGERIPVDAIVVAGSSAIDAALLTGEARPIDVAVGARVLAGTVNLAAPIDLRATEVGEATRVGALATTIATQAARKANIERLVDRIAARFVVVVTLAAFATFVAWSFVASPLVGAEHAMALLVVTCPCALALATPLAVATAIGRAARRGILVKGADALERLATPGTLFLDKTGTITDGQLAIASWHGTQAVRALVTELEAASAHPIARAFAPTGATRATDVREELGRGISGTVDGRLVVVGSPSWVGTHATMTEALGTQLGDLASRAETPIAVAIDGVVVACAGLVDPIRRGARAAVAELGALGWELAILSGDDPRVVRDVGASIGIPVERCHGSITPEAKLAIVEDARRRGPVAMVGDGVNDAPAIAAATCGIAVSGAAELAIEVADVYLQTPSI